MSQLRGSSRFAAIVSVALGLVPVGVVLWLERADFADLSLDRPEALAIAAVFVAATVASAGGINHLLTRSLGARITPSESIWLTVVATGLNAVAPVRAGAAARAAYLRRHHGLSVAAFTSTLYGSYLVLLGAGGLSGIAGSLLLEPTNVTVLIGGSICVVTALLLTSVPRLGDSNGGIVSRNVARFTSGWAEIRRNRENLAPLFSLVAVQLAAGIGALWASLRSLGLDLSIGQTAVIASAGVLSTLLAITPGGLGIYEGTVAIVSTIVGSDPGLIVAGALVQRFILLALLAIFAPIGSAKLSFRSGTRSSPERGAPAQRGRD